MKDIRDGAKHVVSGSRHRKGIRLSQGSTFDSNILCAAHENATADLDRYGTEFLRRSEVLFEASKSDRSFEVSNSEPETLRRFAQSVVWREVHSVDGAESRLSLGLYESDMRAAVFDGQSLAWPLIVSRTRFKLGEQLVKFAVHPFRVRFMELSAWTFTAVGHSFWLICDRRGFPAVHDFIRADICNPATVVVGHLQDFRTVGILQKLFANMRDRQRTESRNV